MFSLFKKHLVGSQATAQEAATGALQLTKTWDYRFEQETDCPEHKNQIIDEEPESIWQIMAEAGFDGFIV